MQELYIYIVPFDLLPFVPWPCKCEEYLVAIFSPEKAWGRMKQQHPHRCTIHLRQQVPDLSLTLVMQLDVAGHCEASFLSKLPWFGLRRQIRT